MGEAGPWHGHRLCEEGYLSVSQFARQFGDYLAYVVGFELLPQFVCGYLVGADNR
jgi:hypothetical protein